MSCDKKEEKIFTTWCFVWPKFDKEIMSLFGPDVWMKLCPGIVMKPCSCLTKMN